MNYKETIESLRCCFGFGVCSDCKAKNMTEEDPLPCKLNCKERLGLHAADLIERLTAENAALKKEIRKAGCMFCARFEDCPEGFKPTGQEDCDNCAKKPDCACMKCSGIGSSTDNWEWRGAPEVDL